MKRKSASDGAKGDGPDGIDLAFDPVQAALRQLYEDVASEEIPTEFLDLLDQLEDQSRQTDRD